MLLFSPIINKKDRRTNFSIKRFNAPSFFACTRVMLNRKLIWHCHTITFLLLTTVVYFLSHSISEKKNRIMSTKKLTVKRDTLKQFTQKCQRRYLTWKESKSIRSSEFDSNKHMYALYIYKNNSACIWLHT